jgi:hypothetical protein
MLIQRLWKSATIGEAGEVCAEEEGFFHEQETLSLEQRVTRYFEQWRGPVNRYLVAVFRQRRSCLAVGSQGRASITATHIFTPLATFQHRAFELRSYRWSQNQ